MEAHVVGFAMWVAAVEKAKTTSTDAVIDAIVGTQAWGLTGASVRMLPSHHVTKPVMIGKIRADGQFDVIWETDKEIAGDAWSDYLPESSELDADWTAPISCGEYNTKTKVCGGPSQ